MGFLDTMMGGAMGAGNLGTLFVRLTSDSTSLINGLTKAETSITRTHGVLLKQAGAISIGVTAALTVIGVVAAREAAKFESSFAGVRRTVEATEDQFKELESSFRGMALKLPIDVNEINRIAEAAGQLGIQNENIAGFARTIVDLSRTTNMSSEEGATTLARFANIVSMSQKDFDRLASTIMKLGVTSASTESEISTMALRVAGAGHQIGLTIPEIIAFATSLSSVGLEAEAGGTAISQMMIRMSRAVSDGGDKLATFAATAGMTAEDFTKVFKDDATKAIMAFLDGLGRLSNEGLNIFEVLDQIGLDGIRMTDTLLRASGATKLFAQSIHTGTKAWEENTAMTKAAEIRYATFNSQLTVTWNQIKDLLITIGDSLIPALKGMNEEIRGLVASLKKSEQEAGTLTATFTTLVDIFQAFALGCVVVWTTLKSIASILAGDVTLAIEMVNLGIDYTVKLYKIWTEAISSVIKGLINLARTATQTKSVMEALAKGNFGEASKIFTKMSKDSVQAATDINTAVTGAVNQSAQLIADSAVKGFDLVLGVSELTFNEIMDQWSVVAGLAEKWFGKSAAGAAATKDHVKEISKELVEANKPAKDLENKFAKMAADSKMVSDILDKIGAAKTTTGFLTDMGVPASMQKAMLPKMQESTGLDNRIFGDSSTAQMAAMQEEMIQAQNRLAILEELGNQEVALTEDVQKRKEAAIVAYTQRVKDLQTAQTALILNSASQMFGDLSEVAEAFGGKQSGIYKTMFAMSKAFAIAESIIKIQQGIAAAASLPFPTNIPAMAAVAAATSNIVSTIAAVKLEFGGARRLGGPVQAGKAYLVGEDGPEPFIPAQNGTILPTDSLNSNGGGGTRVVINNYTDAKPFVTERNEGGERLIEVTIKRVKDEIGSELREGRGVITRALEGAYGVRRGGK